MGGVLECLKRLSLFELQKPAESNDIGNRDRKSERVPDSANNRCIL